MNLPSIIEIGTFTGLPAHPFLNRIAMYVVPTSIALTLLTLVWARHRARLALWSFVGAIAALVAVQLTMGAGEVLDNVVHRDANPLVEQHEDWSKLLRFGLVGQVLFTGLMWWSQRRSATKSSTARVSPALMVAMGLVGLGVAGNTYLTVMTAHTGSKSVYDVDGKIMRGELPPESGDTPGP
jgi:hypothetical protein